MAAYYNEIDPYAAQWLRNLIAVGHIPEGDVDERSIADVRPDDIRGYVQCHFFAGIGGWPHALRLAGWADSRPVWTGSCPCQPFSVGGEGKGSGDARHLWPEFRRLIAECRPAIVFGEQVESPLAWAWLANVRADMEAEGYALGAASLCSPGVGGPHIRQRIYFVSHPNDGHLHGWDSVVQMGRESITEEVAQHVHNRGMEWRPESRVPIVAYGVPARVAKCSAIGNAIVPPLAAAFIESVM